MLRRSLLLAALVTGTLPAQTPAETWQGRVTLNNEPRRVVLQLAPTPTAFFLEFLHDPPRIDTAQLAGNHLHLALNNGEGLFDATLDRSTATLTGTLTWDHESAPLTLHPATAATAWGVPFLYQYHDRAITYLRPAPDEPRIPFSPRLAVDYMEQGAVAWTHDWQCVACHTNGTYMVVRPLLTPQLGPPSPILHDYFLSTLRQMLAAKPAEVEPTQLVYVAAGLAIWDANVTRHLSPETSQALQLMFQLQQPDGAWPIEDDNNPPLESSPYQLATVAARAIGNAPGWLARQRGTPLEPHILLLETLLRQEQKLQGDYDRTDLLWAAAELPGLLNATRKQQLVSTILAHQRADGGWSIRTFATPEQWGKGNRAAKLRAEPELLDPPSDGHMTGLALIALRKSGVPASDPRIQRGVAWLIANQRASGRWYTRSLNRDGWQFITYSGTAYPLLALALCNALPADL